MFLQRRISVEKRPRRDQDLFKEKALPEAHYHFAQCFNIFLRFLCFWHSFLPSLRGRQRFVFSLCRVCLPDTIPCSGNKDVLEIVHRVPLALLSVCWWLHFVLCGGTSTFMHRVYFGCSFNVGLLSRSDRVKTKTSSRKRRSPRHTGTGTTSS